MQTQKTVRASLSSNGDEPSYPFQSPPSNVNSDHPVISADGKLVAFHSIGVYNGSDDNLNYGDVFIRNLDTHKTSLVSLKSNGKQGTGESGYTDPHPIEMSHDGRFVAFDSLARLSPTDTDMVGDVYVRDRKAGKTKLVTVTSSGKPREKVDAALPALSANGKWVAFASADPYVGNDHNKDATSTSAGHCSRAVAAIELDKLTWPEVELGASLRPHHGRDRVRGHRAARPPHAARHRRVAGRPFRPRAG